MAKASGLGARFFVAGVDLSGDTGGLSAIGSSRPTKNVTGIDKSAFERIHLLKNGRVSWAAHWNPAGAHVTLSALPTADQPVMYCHRATLGAPAASMVGKQINYDGTRATDGGLDFTVDSQSDGFGLEWGKLLTAGIAETTGAASQTGLDFGSATSFGLQAYLHVFSFTGTSATVAIQESSDDGAGDAYTDLTGATFVAVTAAPGSQRLQTDRDQAVEQWLRVNVTGTFTDFDFAVAVTKNTHEVLF